MKNLLTWLLLTASVSAYSQERLKLTTSHTFVLNHPEMKPIKVYVKFENGREQYAIKIDSNYYFVRRVYLYLIKVKVVSFRDVKK